jgi:ribonuclease D
MNSRQIDSSGGALPVDTAALEGLWRQARSASAGAGDTPVVTIAAWHEREASEGEANHRWFVARFHLQRLLELDPQNPEVLARLTAAQAALEKERQGRANAAGFANRQQGTSSRRN